MVLRRSRLLSSNPRGWKGHSDCLTRLRAELRTKTVEPERWEVRVYAVLLGVPAGLQAMSSMHSRRPSHQVEPEYGPRQVRSKSSYGSENIH